MCRAQWRLLTKELAGRSWKAGARPIRNGQRWMGITVPCHFPGVSTRSDNLIMRHSPPCENTPHALELMRAPLSGERARAARNNKNTSAGHWTFLPWRVEIKTKGKKQSNQLDGKRAREHPV